MEYFSDFFERIKNRRPYAGFWVGKNKNLKEWNVAKSLFDSLIELQEAWFSEPRRFEPDPPDCIALDGNNVPIAIEVTELVSEKAIKENISGHRVVCLWNSEEIIAEIRKALNNKDLKNLTEDRIIVLW